MENRGPVLGCYVRGSVPVELLGKIAEVGVFPSIPPGATHPSRSSRKYLVSTRG